jgi:phage terminase large subunit GpA-like protein
MTETFLQVRMTRKRTTGYSDLGDLFSKVACQVLVPPRRMTVAEWAEDPADGRFINQPGAYVGNWKNETTPYMVEPAEVLTSPQFKGCVFAGPAQCAKTDALIVNWIGYAATTDPQDMIVYSPTFTAARDFSMRRVDRLHRHTKSVGAALVKDKDSDNKFDKHYENGMLLSLSYPSVTELAGKPVGRVAITDYDRIPDDIGGDGNAYDLASKRTTTFGSFAMTLAESSPSREITDYKKVVRGHAAPPTTGILALYNRGDRRRWHWPCPDCGSYFEGRWEHVKWDNSLDGNLDKAESAYMECPHCAYEISAAERTQMNIDGVWLKEGQRIEHDRIVGKGRRSNIASFWLMGVAAGLTTWTNLVKTYLDAEDEYEASGDEGALSKFINTDIGVPYIPKDIANDNSRTLEDLIGRVEPWAKKKVPPKVRFLLGLVDVQKNMFVVQIIGVAPGKPYDLYLVDRFDIKYSKRADESSPEGQENYLWVKPGSYLEDWDEIIEQVMKANYEIDDDSGRRMAVKLTLCDSGGKAGVTTNAYNFMRKIRSTGWLGRFHLVKGDAVPGAPRARITFPDADKKSKAGAKGEIPVLLLNPTINKDNLNARLDVVVPGYGMIHLPDWLISHTRSEDMSWFFAEMTSETRIPGKGWEKVAKRNEAWDLFYYCIGACASSLLNVEKLDWDKPPAWASPANDNPLVFAADKSDEEMAVDSGGSNFDWSAFGRKMG